MVDEMRDSKMKKAILNKKKSKPRQPRWGPNSSSFKNKFQESEKRYQALLKRLPVGVYRMTPDGKIIEANPALAQMLGYKRVSELRNINVKNLYVRERDWAKHLKKLETAMPSFAEFKLRHKNGQMIWGRDYSRAVLGPTGKIALYDGILVEITREKKAEEKLRKKLEKSNSERQDMIQKLENSSITDDLTGLYNRRGFFMIGREYLLLASRKKISMFLLFMDMDELKHINDTLGHHAGDAALIQMAKILKKTFRNSDIKGRMGGDEFAIFPIDTSIDGVEAAMKRLEENIKAFNSAQGSPFKLSISTGIADYDPEHPSTIEELLIRADKQMYEYKRKKR